MYCINSQNQIEVTLPDGKILSNKLLRKKKILSFEEMVKGETGTSPMFRYY